MIQGLRLLPWIQARRDEARRNGNHTTAERYLECDHCIRDNSVAVRRRMGCGWMPASDRTGTFKAIPAGAEYRPSQREGETTEDYLARWDRYLCPGWLIRLPEVIEVARLYLWWDKGQLALALDGEHVTERLRDLIEIFHAAVGAVQRDQMEAAATARPGR